MQNVHDTAQILARFDSAMRRPHGRQLAVSSRLRFYEEAVRRFAVRRLNSLGELVPQSTLSERSLDVIFEDRRYAAAVIAHVVQLCDRDPAFRAALIQQEGPAALSYWQSQVRGHSLDTRTAKAAA